MGRKSGRKRSRRKSRKRQRRPNSQFIAESMLTEEVIHTKRGKLDAGIVKRKKKNEVNQGIGEWKYLSVTPAERAQRFMIAEEVESFILQMLEALRNRIG